MQGVLARMHRAMLPPACGVLFSVKRRYERDNSQ
jgi:hypothetical protein